MTFTLLPKLRVSKNSIVLLLSLSLAGVGVFYSREYINSQVEYQRQKLDKPMEMTELVVPRRSLQRGEMLVHEDLSVRQIPVEYADSNSVTASNYESALGQRLSFDIDEGRPLLWAHLEGGVTATFSGKVPAGLRAMTVRVDEINSISGFLQPRDKIDLLLTYGSRKNNRVFPLIQNLDVFATGIQTLVDKSGGSGQRAFTTITVKVTPEEAKKITLAQQAGKLTAMLRNPEDEAPLNTQPLTMAQLLNLDSPRKPARQAQHNTVPASRAHTIEYIIGGT